MAPDRVMVLADWIRWKHRFTLLVLSLIATTIAAVVIGLWSLNVTNAQRARIIAQEATLLANRAAVIAQHADSIAIATELQEKFAATNRQLIIDNCETVEAYKAGMRLFLDDLTQNSPPERRDALLNKYDLFTPPVDCTKIPEAP